MKIAVVNLTGGGLSSGYRKYLEHLVPRLREHPVVEQVYVLVPSQAAAVAEAIGAPATTWPAGSMSLAWRWLRSEVHRFAADVVFIPTARWLDFGPTPTVVMVRNMEPLTRAWQGNSWGERLKNIARRRAARTACRRASRVIAVSQHVRSFLLNTWEIGAASVSLVYHGLDAPMAPGDALRPKGIGDCNGDSFVFTAGSIRPARGLEDVLEAWPRVRQKVPRVRLVIAGRPDQGTEAYLARLRRLAEASGIAADLTWAGHLNEREMAWCFHHSAAFVMTSRAEACPNTALEAMNYGALCVSTDWAPMPEFFRDGARYYRAFSPSSLAEMLLGVLTAGRAEEEHLRGAALDRARDFCWRRTAERTIVALRIAVQAPSR